MGRLLGRNDFAKLRPMDKLEIDLRVAERDLEREEAARLRRLLKEIKGVLVQPWTPEQKVQALQSKLDT